jgi:hypothetical protein
LAEAVRQAVVIAKKSVFYRGIQGASNDAPFSFWQLFVNL